MSVVVSAGAVEAALDKMKKMLAADGYELGIAVDDGGVSLDVRATPEACAECLVPKALFASMATDMLAKGGVAVDTANVQVIYPTEH